MTTHSTTTEPLAGLLLLLGEPKNKSASTHVLDCIVGAISNQGDAFKCS